MESAPHSLPLNSIIQCHIHIKRGAWIGAGVTVMPGVTIGRYAVVGAASVVTHDVPDHAIVVGSPAKVVKYLEKEKFPKD